MRATCAVLLAFMLAFVVAVPASAQDVSDVRWTVAESNLYTVEGNGDQPVVTFNDCLAANQTYTINFSVTVEAEGSYEARIATVGEGSQNLIPQGFQPASVSGEGTQTFEASGTFRARDVSFSDARDTFGVYLEGEDESVLDESFMTVAFDCIAQNGLPGTGADTLLTGTLPVAMLVSGLVLVGAGFAIRRRLAMER